VETRGGKAVGTSPGDKLLDRQRKLGKGRGKVGLDYKEGESRTASVQEGLDDNVTPRIDQRRSKQWVKLIGEKDIPCVGIIEKVVLECRLVWSYVNIRPLADCITLTSTGRLAIRQMSRRRPNPVGREAIKKKRKGSVGGQGPIREGCLRHGQLTNKTATLGRRRSTSRNTSAIACLKQSCVKLVRRRTLQRAVALSRWPLVYQKRDIGCADLLRPSKNFDVGLFCDKRVARLWCSPMCSAVFFSGNPVECSEGAGAEGLLVRRQRLGVEDWGWSPI